MFLKGMLALVLLHHFDREPIFFGYEPIRSGRFRIVKPIVRDLHLLLERLKLLVSGVSEILQLDV
jgi:hypothetical protein